MTDLSMLKCAEKVIVSIKFDGENTSMYNDYIHARSRDYAPHPSRSWIKSLHARIAPDIPVGWRVCGENLYAKHSIKYENLTNYFQVFSIWNEKNICLSWNDTVEWASLLGLQTVPILYVGPWNEKKIKGLYTKELNGDPCEGYVVRVSQEFHYKEFKNCVGKFVRANHVNQNNHHWMHEVIIKNELKEDVRNIENENNK